MDEKLCKNCKIELPEKIKKFSIYCNTCYDKGIMFQKLL